MSALKFKEMLNTSFDNNFYQNKEVSIRQMLKKALMEKEDTLKHFKPFSKE